MSASILSLFVYVCFVRILMENNLFVWFIYECTLLSISFVSTYLCWLYIHNVVTIT